MPRARSKGRHAGAAPFPFWILALILGVGAAGLFAFSAIRDNGQAGERGAGPKSPQTPSPTSSHSSSPSNAPSQSQSVVPTAGPINTKFPGITTFRGNASRSYMGEGPVPMHPVIRWRYPESGGMCSESADEFGSRTWCGTGWTGQPNVIPHKDGSIEIREGAYDGHYHFLSGRTGFPIRPDLVTGDLAKGSATSDPDGYPLYYAGSRDNIFRIVAMDRPRPVVLWSMNAETTVPDVIWNNDWDGAALVVGDYLLEGGENSYFYVVKLNRGYDSKGKVTVDPKIRAIIPGFDQQLFHDIGDQDVSIENSVVYRDGVVYFANSGGLVQGWRIDGLLRGGTGHTRVLRFWTGDDTDATMVMDDEGYLYVASEYQRLNARSRQVGQLMKLDPSKPNDPLVWGIDAQEVGFEGAGGSWSTPAVYGDTIYFTTGAGRVMGVRRDNGHIVWEKDVGPDTISSPVVVDGVLIQGDCRGNLWAWDVSNPKVDPPRLWRLHLGSCVESTPAVWHGWMWVGTRGGGIYGISDPDSA